MKIVMISPLYDPHTGGVEKHVKRVSEELVKKDNDVLVLTLKHDSNLPDFELKDKIEIYRFPKAPLVQIWRWLIKRRSILREADVVHCHDVTTFLYYLPFRLLNPTVPVYITFHGFEGIIPIPKSIKLKRKVAEKLTNGNICVGHYIQKWYGTRADTVIYGAVDSVITSLHTMEPDISDRPIDAVFVGRLEKDTGIMIYINAIRILKDKFNQEIEVHLCGDGTLRDSITEIGRKYKLNLHLHGFVDPKPYLKRAKFAFTSGYLSILEAMAESCLVFSVYDNPLKEDYLRMMPCANLLVICSNPEDLATSILNWRQNIGQVADKVRVGRDYALQQTWGSIANIYTHLWRVKS